MSKSTKPYPCIYNNDYTYLVNLSTEEKYTTSITKHYARRYYKEGIEDMNPERWRKYVRLYHFESLNDQALYRVLRFYSLFGGLRERLKKFSWLRFGRHEGVLGCGLCSIENFLVAFCLGLSAAFWVLRFAPCILVGKGSAFCLIEDLYCVLLKRSQDCVLSSLCFVSEGEPDLHVHVPESFQEQTDEELTENDIKRIDADDQAIQTILLGLPEDAFQLTAPTNNNQRTLSNPRNCQIAQPVQNADVHSGGNQNGLVVVPGISNQNGTSNVFAARAEGTGNGNQARCYSCRGLGIQLQAEEFDFIAAVGDLDEIEKVNANCILMENLQHASTSGTQLDKAPIYDTDGLTE
nr:hypothetical protein [Tanacetum cinerariifolium]GEY87252.1 hypothetical protein [Tanacetum cinerariifolium]